MCLVPCSFQRVSVQGVSAVADRHSKILDAYPPQGPNSFNFMHFWEILAKSYVGAPWRVGTPPRGNPGSAAALSSGASVRETISPYDEERAVCILL